MFKRVKEAIYARLVPESGHGVGVVGGGGAGSRSWARGTARLCIINRLKLSQLMPLSVSDLSEYLGREMQREGREEANIILLLVSF